MSNSGTSAPPLSTDFIAKACIWAQRFETVCVLNNNQIKNALGLQEIEFALAVGEQDSLLGNGENDWAKLKSFVDKHSGETPVFGYLTYDLKNQLEQLESKHPDKITFAPLFFFVPEHLILIDTHGQLMVMSEDGNKIVQEIESTAILQIEHKPIEIKSKASKADYINQVKSIQNHIVEGDVYELNYCVEFYAENVLLDPIETYFQLQAISPTPFACFFKWQNRFLISASPERFMRKSLNQLQSQPIKGTVRRSAEPKEDLALINKLRSSEKEQAENLMIVDLVRNDLAKSSEVGTVSVDELFGIYSFKQVHQMISTVSSTIKDGLHPVEALSNAFPMGSMTGAPKIMAMKLIEQFEQTKRGLYSGSVGYFSPNEDFDFNVVIRSIQYNALTQYLSFEVGSAITFDSNPEHEYEECLLKAQAMLLALNASLV